MPAFEGSPDVSKLISKKTGEPEEMDWIDVIAALLICTRPLPDTMVPEERICTGDVPNAPK